MVWERAALGEGKKGARWRWFWGVEDAVDGMEEEDGDAKAKDGEVVEEDS
jgi:hypothetical protein